MNTRYEKHSISLASVNYRNRRRAKRLKCELAVFFAVLFIICTGLYIITQTQMEPTSKVVCSISHFSGMLQ